MEETFQAVQQTNRPSAETLGATLRVLRIQTAMPRGSVGAIDAALLGGRMHAYDLRLFLSGHPAERADAEWFAKTSLGDPCYFNRGFVSKEGKSIGEKVEFALRSFMARSRMLAEARIYRPDIVTSTQHGKDLALTHLIAKHLGLPYVVNLHYAIGDWFSKEVLRILKGADCIVVYSSYMKRNAQQFGTRRAEVVYPSIPTYQLSQEERAAARREIREEAGIPLESLVIGMGTRIEDWKGQLDVVKAFQTFSSRFEDTYLMFAGRGGGEEHLRAQIAAGPHPERVKLMGIRYDMPRIIASWDIAAHPSRAEAFGLAVAEASVAGLPVVVYADGAAPEIIEHGVTGFVVPLTEEGLRGENIEGLVNAFTQLITNETLRENMGIAGVSHIREVFTHTAQRSALQYSTILRDVAAQVEEN